MLLLFFNKPCVVFAVAVKDGAGAGIVEPAGTASEDEGVEEATTPTVADVGVETETERSLG